MKEPRPHKVFVKFIEAYIYIVMLIEPLSKRRVILRVKKIRNVEARGIIFSAVVTFYNIVIVKARPSQVRVYSVEENNV